ncbi:MAG: methyltransferase domain-containing protein [Terriglobales bacterium]|jgi:hypothetical protein
MPQRKAIRITGIVLACLMWTIPPGFGQEISRAEHERHIASLPEEQRTFQRFRFWFAALPESERQSDRKDQQGWHEALLGKYAAWLTAGGFTSGDVQKQITLLKKRGPADDAEFWNTYLITGRKQWLNSEPNGFLVEMVKGRKPGRALDVAMGQGRNTVWLAQQGWDVTGFDPADQAVTEANEAAQRFGVTIHTEVTTMSSLISGRTNGT